MFPTASESAFLYQLDRSLLTCRRRSCKCSAFADLIFPIASDAAFLYQLEGSLLTLRRWRRKCSAFADWINPLRERSKETLRVSDYIPLRAGGVGRDTISWPIKLRSANLGTPPGGPPWPYGIRRQLVPANKPDCTTHGPRADYVCIAETCDEFRLHRNSSVCSADATQTAIETRIGRGKTCGRSLPSCLALRERWRSRRL